jgi:hypothetical protein
MLTKEELHRIHQNAYLPEHLPDYVQAVSDATPHLFERVLFFLRRRHLIFIGYPLGNTAVDVESVYSSVCQKFNPTVISIIAPKLWLPAESYEKQVQDHYYRLDLPLVSMDSEVAYMIRRAQRELRVVSGKFGRQHKKLVNAFLKQHELTPEQTYLFKHIPHYLKHSGTSRLLEARKDHKLVAFTVMDLGSQDYAFYMFNFRSKKINIPGASDLLFNEMVKLSEIEGKKTINLGLGVHAGIRRFKQKWGGVPFLDYNSVLLRRDTLELGDIAKKL